MKIDSSEEFRQTTPDRLPQVRIHRTNIRGIGATRLTESLLPALHDAEGFRVSEDYRPMSGPLAAASGKNVCFTKVRRHSPSAIARPRECGRLSRRVIAECDDCDAATRAVRYSLVFWLPDIRFERISLPTALLVLTRYSAAFGAFFLCCLYAGLLASVYALFALLGIRHRRRCCSRVGLPAEER